jgi:cold shock protein
MNTGTIKIYRSSKGFGFIKPDEGKEDVFFHRKNLIDDETKPSVDDKVSYEAEETDRGLNALKVKITEKGSSGEGKGENGGKHRASDVIPVLCDRIRFLEGKSLTNQEIMDELMG